MKASLKLREEQKPLFRAKVPLNILGFPFQSGIVAGESKELSLNLATFFESGPSLKLAYRPNDSLNPFSLVFKTGIGHFGSPISSAINMTAEFNLIGGAQNQNPSFFVHFKPQFGDFALKKTQSSLFKKPAAEDGSVTVDFVENGKKFVVSPLASPAAGVVKGVLSDVEVSARSAVPLRKNSVLNFRWGIRFPATALGDNLTAGNLLDKFPVLMMNKIGIEHVAREEWRDSSKVTGGHSDGEAAATTAAACLGVKRQLEIIQAENGMLRKAMDDLKSEFFGINSGRLAGGEELSGNFSGRAMEDEDLKKNKGFKGTSD